MNERIDIFIKNNRGRWIYFEGTRLFTRLIDARRHYSLMLGEPVQARWPER